MRRTKPEPIRAAQVPEKASVDGLEAKWVPRWEESGVYRFNETATREQIYSIDTPPPTASGSLHVGHIFFERAQPIHGLVRPPDRAGVVRCAVQDEDRILDSFEMGVGRHVVPERRVVLG